MVLELTKDNVLQAYHYPNLVSQKKLKIMFQQCNLNRQIIHFTHKNGVYIFFHIKKIIIMK